MRRYFTQYWTNSQWKLETKVRDQNSPLEHTAGNQFSKVSVSENDIIFIVTVKKGILYLGGKIVVGRLCSQRQVEEMFGSKRVYQAKEHIISKGGLDTFRTNLTVPSNVVKYLYFEGPDGPKPPVFKSEGVLDQQTLRGVRLLTEKSGEELLKLL